MPAQAARKTRGVAVAAAALLAGLLLAMTTAQAQAPGPAAAARPAAAGKPAVLPAPTPAARPLVRASRPRPEEGVRWQNLSAAQRQVLAPLEHQWSSIDAPRKQKWLVIAQRFKSLSPLEQARINDRMNAWARLTPAERGEMRLRYQESRQVRVDRSARWQAYQQLSAEQRREFEARAASPSGKADAGHPAGQGKINIVSNPALAQPPRPVAPTIVQASRGATTHLITRPMSPPAHQQTGMPKIAATPEFVNRSTLLPRRGPQAAGVMPPSVPVRSTTAPRVPPPATAARPGATVSSSPSR